MYLVVHRVIAWYILTLQDKPTNLSIKHPSNRWIFFTGKSNTINLLIYLLILRQISGYVFILKGKHGNQSIRLCPIIGYFIIWHVNPSKISTQPKSNLWIFLLYMESSTICQLSPRPIAGYLLCLSDQS